MRLRVLRMLFAIYRSCSTGTPTEGTRGCEHATALLLAWNKQPEMFTQTDDIDTILERHSKAQLITLVKQLLQKQPKVEWQLTMPPLASHKSVPIDTQEYRRQVDAAFRHAGFAVYRFDVNYGGFGLTGDIPSNSHKSTSLNRNQFALLRSFHQEKIYT